MKITLKVAFNMLIFQVLYMIIASSSSATFQILPSHTIQNLNSTSINSDGSIIASISGYFDYVTLTVKSFQNGNQINSTQTTIPVSFYFVWRIQITQSGNKIFLLSMQTDKIIVLQRDQSGKYEYISTKVISIGQNVSLLDTSYDGNVILVSDYLNLTQVHREDSTTGNYNYIQSFDTLGDDGRLNLTDYFISNIQISEDPQAKYIILSNFFFNQITNQTLYNAMIYTKNSAGDYDLQQAIELDPTYGNQIYQSRISTDGLTIFMRGVFGTQMYKRGSTGATFFNIQNISACWNGGPRSAMSDDGNTLYFLCGSMRQEKTLLVYAYDFSSGIYIRVQKYENIKAQTFYISGDGSKLIFVDYRNNLITYASFNCNSGQYYTAGKCETCTQTQHLLGTCTTSNTNLSLILSVTIIPLILIILAILIICCIRQKLKQNQNTKVNISSMTIQDLQVVQPRTFVFDEEGNIAQNDEKLRVTSQKICEICNKDGVTHIIKCNHMFHHDCIRSWVYRGNDYCPICKHSLQMNDIKSAQNSSSSSSDSGQKKSDQKRSDDEIKNSNNGNDIKTKKQRKRRPIKQKSVQQDQPDEMFITK